MTTDTHETKLVEALKAVEKHGDVAPGHVHDPTTMVLRQTAIQGDLMRWDDDRGHYVLTLTGRNRILARGRARGGGRLLQFPRKGDAARETIAPRAKNSSGS